MKRLAVLLSGRGSNFEAIADRIKEGKLLARIEVVVSNVDSAPALEKARQRGLNTVVLNSKELGKEKFEQTLEKILKDLNQRLPFPSPHQWPLLLTPFVELRFAPAVTITSITKA